MLATATSSVPVRLREEAPVKTALGRGVLLAQRPRLPQGTDRAAQSCVLRAESGIAPAWLLEI